MDTTISRPGFDPMDLRIIPGKRLAYLLDDFLPPFPFDRHGPMEKGFLIDGASVPNTAQGIAKLFGIDLDPFGDLLPGAIPHDWYYKLCLLCPRLEADQIMREVLKLYQNAGYAIPSYSIHGSYAVLRAAGGFTWNPREEAIRAGNRMALDAPLIYDLDTYVPIKTVGDVLAAKGLA